MENLTSICSAVTNVKIPFLLDSSPNSIILLSKFVHLIQRPTSNAKRISLNLSWRPRVHLQKPQERDRLLHLERSSTVYPLTRNWDMQRPQWSVYLGLLVNMNLERCVTVRPVTKFFMPSAFPTMTSGVHAYFLLMWATLKVRSSQNLFFFTLSSAPMAFFDYEFRIGEEVVFNQRYAQHPKRELGVVKNVEPGKGLLQVK